MTWLLWLAGAAILAVAGLSVWKAFQDPRFYLKALAAIFESAKPYLKWLFRYSRPIDPIRDKESGHAGQRKRDKGW